MIRLLTPTAASLALALAFVSGCDKQAADSANEPGADERAATGKTAKQGANSAADEPQIVFKEGPQPTAETVLARADSVEVRLSDFQRAMRQSTLVAPDDQLEPPKEQLANPHLQVNVVRNLLSSQIIVEESKRRGLEATADEKVAALKERKRLSAYAPLLEAQDADADALRERGLSLDDLDSIATELVLRDKLRDALLADLTDERLWKAYQQQSDRMRLLVASARNTPTMEEISAFVDEHADRIKEHFADNKSDYRDPTMVRLVMLSSAPGAQPDAAALEQAAERLDEGEAPETIASELGLELDADALLVRGENPEAFEAEPASTGVQTEGARGAYAWKVIGMRPSKEAKLTAAIEREIAAELLRDNAVVASRAKLINEALAAMQRLDIPADDAAAKEALDGFEAELEQKGLQVEHTPMFVRNERGFIPGVGLAEEVVEAAASLSADEPVADAPILSRSKVWAVRLLDRQTKTRADFEKEKESFREEYTQRVRNNLIDRFVDRYEREHDAQMDLAPLQIKYGVLQK